MSYDFTNISGANNTLQLFQGVNDTLMFGWFGNLILMGLWIMLFLGFLNTTQDSGKAIAGASWIAFGFALLLRAVDLTHDLTVFITLIVAAASIAFIYKQR